MTLKQYFTVMILGSILCWAAWWIVVINIDPFQDTGLGFSFFYISLFLALLGTISIFAFMIRRFFSKEQLPMFRYVQKSFKDSVFFSGLIIVLLYLQGINYLRWWNALLLLGALILYLAFVWSTKNNHNHQPHFNS
ncbi:MAG: hypothetical protein WA057_03040 [Candidatus Magasanikiibacteriota bacterium]